MSPGPSACEADVIPLHHVPYVRDLPADARVAQWAERKALNLPVVGSSPTVGVILRKCLRADYGFVSERKNLHAFGK